MSPTKSLTTRTHQCRTVSADKNKSYLHNINQVHPCRKCVGPFTVCLCALYSHDLEIEYNEAYLLVFCSIQCAWFLFSFCGRYIIDTEW